MSWLSRRKQSNEWNVLIGDIDGFFSHQFHVVGTCETCIHWNRNVIFLQILLGQVMSLKMWMRCRPISLHFQFFMLSYQINGLVQERRNSIANALELCLSCSNPLRFRWEVQVQVQACLSCNVSGKEDHRVLNIHETVFSEYWLGHAPMCPIRHCIIWGQLIS